MDCCEIDESNKNRVCQRIDGKLFNLPRKYSKKKCLKKRGFSMKSSCAPYKYCQTGGATKKKFLFDPNNPTKSFDVYIDKNPSDTIPIKYTTVQDVKNTINKLETLYKSKKYPHKRIWQVGMILKVRLGAMKKHKKKLYPKAKNVNKRFNLANKYFKFLGKRTKMIQNDRMKSRFIF